MEYIASSKQEVNLLKEARDHAHEFVSKLTSKVENLAELANLHSGLFQQHFDHFGSLAEFVKEFESSVTAQNKAIAAQQQTIAAVTKAQSGLQATMETYIGATSEVIEELPRIYHQGEAKIDHTIKLIFERAKEIDRMKELVNSQQGLLSEIPVIRSELSEIKALLLRSSTSKATQTSPSNSGDDSDSSSSSSDGGDHSGGSAGAGTYSGGPSGAAPMAAVLSPLNNDAKKGERQLATFLVLPPIFEHPEQEDQAVAADQTVNISSSVVAQDAPATSVFNEVSFEEQRLNALLIREWAEAAVVEGPVESFEQLRWEWTCRPAVVDTSDQEMISSVISKKRKGKEIMDSQQIVQSESPVAKKLKVTEEDMEEMMRIAAELDAEEQVKAQLQLVADRELQLKLFADEAAINDEAMKKQLADDEASLKLAKKLIKEDQELKLKGKKPPKPSKKSKNVDSDRLLADRDRKVYAQRMVGRSNPAPITKVLLKKSKSASQTQLQIHRGDQRQAITLDQICKLHREEWNEIRLAISHSTSAAKEEVMQEIDRLFSKMVRLGLLREDEVSAGTEREMERPSSPRYSTGPHQSLYRVPNIRNLNLSLPENVQRVDGLEVLHPEVGVVYSDGGRFYFQREAELEKADHDQLMNMILKVACLPDNSKMRKAVIDEALARHMRYLPSEEKYQIMRLLEKVKMEDP